MPVPNVARRTVPPFRQKSADQRGAVRQREPRPSVARDFPGARSLNANLPASAFWHRETLALAQITPPLAPANSPKAITADQGIFQYQRFGTFGKLYLQFGRARLDSERSPVQARQIVHSRVGCHISPGNPTQIVNQLGHAAQNSQSILQIVVMPSENERLPEEGCEQHCVEIISSEGPTGHHRTALDQLGWQIPERARPGFPRVVRSQ